MNIPYKTCTHTFPFHNQSKTPFIHNTGLIRNTFPLTPIKPGRDSYVTIISTATDGRLPVDTPVSANKTCLTHNKYTAIYHMFSERLICYFSLCLSTDKTSSANFLLPQGGTNRSIYNQVSTKFLHQRFQTSLSYCQYCL